MVKKYFSIILSVLVLGLLIGGTAVWIRAFYSSIQNYRSPLRAVSLVPQPSISPKTSQVVMVLISGLGYDASLELGLPVLEQLKRAGASVAVQSTPPTYSQTSWATLISGAPPETNDAPPVDVPVDNLHLLEIDTIFARAYEARMSTALLGTSDWRRLIPRNQLSYTFIVDQPGAEADEVITETALPLITAREANFILIHFTQVDFAGQYQGGAEGEAYRQAAFTVDSYLSQIVAAMDFSRSVLVILSDHGHISSGGYGGDEVEVIWQPLVMIGENIIPGSYSDINQIDVAPTISTLLGLPLPTTAQGRILFEMLRLNEQERATAQMAVAQQRVALAEAYLEVVDKSSDGAIETLQADLNRAKSAFENRNINGAFQLALLAQEEADRQMVAARSNRIKVDMAWRFIVVVLIGLAWFTTMWRRRNPHVGLIIITVVITLALYHSLFQLQGYNYSISSIVNFANLPIEVTRRVGVSLLAGGGLVLVFLVLFREENWLIVLGTGYGYGLLMAFVFVLPLFWAFWQNGFVVDWRLPAVVPTYWQITSLIETMITAIMAMLMPWPIMSFTLLINLIRRHLYEARARADSDALPGLHL